MSYYWKPYVPVAERRRQAKKKLAALEKKGQAVQPVQVEGRVIAKSFWGAGWCEHLESFSDYENRLPRGKTYVRNGSVCHLEIQSGRISALVIGSRLYKIEIAIAPLPPKKWKALQKKCQGEVGSLLELLQGKLSQHVMAVVSDVTDGLFPSNHEIKLKCSCPDWAYLCKHLAAALYGVGSRLDEQPELLFLLRGVDPAELISDSFALPTAATNADVLEGSGLADIFGIELETENADMGKETSKAAGKRKAAPQKRSKSPTLPAASKVTLTNKPRKKSKTASGAKQKALPQPKKAARRIFNPLRPTGKAIARLRKHSGLEVFTFAHVLGVSPASVYRWEKVAGSLDLRPHVRAALEKFQTTLPD